MKQQKSIAIVKAVSDLLKIVNRLQSYAYFRFEESGQFGGKRIRAGFYVPIDYDHVGSLSNAVGKGWELQYIYKPVEIYGRAM